MNWLAKSVKYLLNTSAQLLYVYFGYLITKQLNTYLRMCLLELLYISFPI